MSIEKFLTIVSILQYLWMLVIMSAAADLYTTYLGMENGYIEVNPLANQVLQANPVLLVIIKLLIIGIIYNLNRQFVFDDLAYVAPSITSVIWFYASVHNLLIIGIL